MIGQVKIISRCAGPIARGRRLGFPEHRPLKPDPLGDLSVQGRREASFCWVAPAALCVVFGVPWDRRDRGCPQSFVAPGASCPLCFPVTRSAAPQFLSANPELRMAPASATGAPKPAVRACRHRWWTACGEAWDGAGKPCRIRAPGLSSGTRETGLPGQREEHHEPTRTPRTRPGHRPAAGQVPTVPNPKIVAGRRSAGKARSWCSCGFVVQS